MINGKKVSAIIPARGGSKRLKGKNIFPVLGKPMICYAIEACQKSDYVDEIIVSSDCEKIKSVVKNFKNVIFHSRSESLSDDKTFKQDVIVEVLRSVYENSKEEKPKTILSVQANSPEISDKIIDEMIETKLKFNKKEIFSVDKDLMQNGAVRVMDYEYCFLKTLSMYCGVYICDLHDVHTIKDVEIVEKRMSRK